MKPHARVEDVIVLEIGDETILYDERVAHAHRLNRTAALVWSHCNGQRSVPDLAAVLCQNMGAAVTEEVVWLALDRLEKEQLLREKLVRPQDGARVTRRAVLRKAALIGGMTLLLPVVQSMVAPTPAMALSIGCAKRGQSYSVTRPCCPGLRPGGGVCVGHSGQP